VTSTSDESSSSADLTPHFLKYREAARHLWPRGDAARTKLLGGDVRRLRIGEIEVDAAHLPHPGIVMREAKDADATANPWPERNKRFVAQLAAWLRARA
jgi:hypothetical protein